MQLPDIKKMLAFIFFALTTHAQGNTTNHTGTSAPSKYRHVDPRAISAAEAISIMSLIIGLIMLVCCWVFRKGDGGMQLHTSPRLNERVVLPDPPSYGGTDEPDHNTRVSAEFVQA